MEPRILIALGLDRRHLSALAADRWLLIALGALGLLVLLALVARALLRKRAPARTRAPRRPAAPKYPVVLAHGLMGFDVIKVAGREAEYFRGVPPKLRRLGANVHLARVSPSASVARRAEQLAETIRSVDAKRVNVIAHSLGGLDARYAIARLGVANRVASLVTVGTPHRGTPVADVGANVMGDKLGLKKALSMLGVDVGAFYDMTTGQMAGFNREVEDVPGILYGSYAGAVSGKLTRLNPLLLPSYLFLSEQSGPNDGLVPSLSQRWGELLGEIDADHWAQIGWSRRFDAPGFYADLLRELRARGL